MSQLVYNIDATITTLQKNYHHYIAITMSPSRTIDIEKTLVIGVHGPKSVFCFIVTNHTTEPYK